MHFEALYDRAINKGAAKVDVHVMPDSAFVQFRIHGELQPPESISLQDGKALVADATIQLEGGQLRYEIAPGKTVFLATNACDDNACDGRSVVQLMVTIARLALESLGYSPEQAVEIERIAESSSGTFMIAGTTGGSISKNA